MPTFITVTRRQLRGASKLLLCGPPTGLTENAGPEIDRPKKNNRLKMSDMKMTDQIAGHEIAGHENTGHEKAGQENAGQENAKTRTTCYGSRQSSHAYVVFSPPRRDNIGLQKSQSHSYLIISHS